MIQIPMISSAPLDRKSIQNSPYTKTKGAFSSANVSQINYLFARHTQQNLQPYASSYAQNNQQYSANPYPRNNLQQVTYTSSHTYNSTPASSPALFPLPQLIHPTQKGQKTALETNKRLSKITAGFGWNVLDSRCDVDVSAFLLGANGKVIGDSWFVFYGQTQSPDGSTQFLSNSPSQEDRECIKIDLSRLNPAVSRIVFVLTINEALQNRLNFSMLQDAYVRILNDLTGHEVISFKMTEYYSNVNSMMIGEIYLHNGIWKFNAIGNGVARDLAGLCAFYGVQTC